MAATELHTPNDLETDATEKPQHKPQSGLVHSELETKTYDQGDVVKNCRLGGKMSYSVITIVSSSHIPKSLQSSNPF